MHDQPSDGAPPDAPPSLAEPGAPPSLEALAPTLFARPARAERAPVAVIDVLRATTTLPLAFAAGARDAYFFGTPEAAQAALERLRSGASHRLLLCGEREGRRIDGFDLGNSPLEFDAEAVAGACLLVATTNGSRAFLATAGAELQWAVSFVNLKAAVDEISARLLAREDGEDAEEEDAEACDLRVVCAGKEGAAAVEDLACAGLFAMRLMEALGRAGFDARLVADGAALAAAPETERETMRVVAESPHGCYLRALGRDFEADVALCGRWDLTRVVPRGRGAHLFQDGD